MKKQDRSKGRSLYVYLPGFQPGRGERCRPPKMLSFRPGYRPSSSYSSAYTSSRLVFLSAGQGLCTTGRCSRSAKLRMVFSWR